LRHKAIATLTGASSLQKVSDSSRELCPAERKFAQPAIYLPRDIDRITGVMDDTTLDQEMRRIQGGEKLHGATVAYELSDVELSEGFLFKAGWKERLLTTPPRARGGKESIAHGTLSGSFYGSLYFGHWMTDDLTLNAAAEIIGEPVIPEREPYHHEDGYKRLFKLEPRKVSHAHFDKLTILEDIGQNSYKRQRYQQLRSRLLGHFDPPAGRRIMFHRGMSGVSRLLQNEAEVEALLEQSGFSILDPTKLSSEELASQTAGAEIVIGVEGSQLAHALYSMAENGIMCALQPPYRFNNIFKELADCLGLQYAVLTEGGFRIALDEVKELVDRLTGVLAVGRSKA
jgi:hypothetical protein